MINIIIGRNSSGKTLHLWDKLDNLDKSVTITNIEDKLMLDKQLDKEKVNILNRVLPYGFVVNGESLGITDNIDLGRDYLDFLSKIWLKAKYFIYDEPEKKVKDALRGDIYDAIASLGDSFDECWIASNYQSVTTMDHANFWLSIDKCNLKKVSIQEAIEILDNY